MMPATERPHCPKCHELMSFQRTDPGMRHTENRVFECGKCFAMKTIAVQVDVGSKKAMSSRREQRSGR